YVNQPIAEKNLAVQLEAIESLQESILKQWPPDLPDELEFSFTSAYHRSAFLFGGYIKYRKKVSYDPVKFEKINCYRFDDLEVPVAYFLEGGEDLSNWENEHGAVIRYVSGKNKGKPKEFLVDSNTEKLKWGEGTYTFKGLIDLEALPKHVSEQYLGK